mgnify:CR=1 FL=1
MKSTSRIVRSGLYTCKVLHRRLIPRRHEFEYPVFYLDLDLDELDAMDRGLSWFSRNRLNLFSFYDRDHLGGEHDSAREALLDFLATKGADVSLIDSIRVIAFPRVFGYIFNPVSFFFCFDASGAALCSVVQVTNTYREQKLYHLGEPASSNRFRLVTPKHFYVSPFSDLEICFDFNVPVPGEKMDIHINDVASNEVLLLSRLTGRREELTDAALLRCALTYPLLTLQVIWLIHWHALRLWLKKLPVHRKAASPELQTDVLRPHTSIQPRSV